MNHTSRPPRVSKTYGLLLAVLSLVLLTRCSATSSPVEEETVSATFTIQDADLLASSTKGQGRLSALDVRAQAFSLSNVLAIKVSVQDAVTKAFLLVNVDLNKAEGGPANSWSGTIPSLPKGKSLIFSAFAYSSKTVQSAELLFSGTTTQTLTGPNQPIPIVLVPSTDGKEVLLPRISRIAIPSAFVSNQPNNISFLVEGANNAVLNYVVKAAGTDGSGGTFFPANGSLTLSATAGTFVSQYAPPLVENDTTFEHLVTVTNAAGHSVTTTFKTNVKPPGKTNSVADTSISVLFNPVFNALNGRRVNATSDVVFTVDVADDSTEDKLSYTWSFSPTGTFTPAPQMDGSTTRVGTLHNYTKDVQGTLTVAVKDEKSGITTLKYNLTPNQFPDNPYAEGDSNGLNSIWAGDSHTCVLINNGDMRCWGQNESGQLGYNTVETDFIPGNLPFKKGNVLYVGKGARFATGYRHTCVLFDNGYVSCWGKNDGGQLGYNTTDNVGGSRPISEYGYVNLGGAATKITAGASHTCALLATGNVRCWGKNDFGQLGYGYKEDVNIGDDESPSRDVPVGAPVIDIVAGGYHTCALLNTNAVRCWGRNDYGQLGTGNYNNYGGTVGVSGPASSAPTVSLSGGRVLQLAAGGHHTCALLSTGNVRCWGNGYWGQLGNGSTPTYYSTPTADLALGGNVLQVAAGGRHTCALLESGAIKCWGYNNDGELGIPGGGQSAPTSAVNLNGATAFQITTGLFHTCALLSTGKARCWGFGGNGQLGYGDKNNVSNGYTSGDIAIFAP